MEQVKVVTLTEDQLATMLKEASYNGAREYHALLNADKIVADSQPVRVAALAEERGYTPQVFLRLVRIRKMEKLSSCPVIVPAKYLHEFPQKKKYA